MAAGWRLCPIGKEAREVTFLLLFSAAILFTALHHAKKVTATPSQGYVSTTLALGRFGAINILNHLKGTIPIARPCVHNGDGVRRCRW